jgi:FixJ family two-component response regulator
MSVTDAIVYIVDDDPSVRKATLRLLRSAGYHAVEFETAEDFLSHRRANRPSCLILDLQMPGLSGVELQQQLEAHHEDLPIVFMTGHGDIPTSVEAMKHGAVDFLPKPVDDEKLLETVRLAVEQHARTRHQSAELAMFRGRTGELTAREREVMLYVITGMMNKQIARNMGITETTVKVHRGRMMEKTGVASVAELVLLCERAGITTSTN